MNSKYILTLHQCVHNCVFVFVSTKHLIVEFSKSTLCPSSKSNYSKVLFLQVTCFDGNLTSNVSDVYIKVKDINDNSPTFSRKVYDLALNEVILKPFSFPANSIKQLNQACCPVMSRLGVISRHALKFINNFSGLYIYQVCDITTITTLRLNAKI